VFELFLVEKESNKDGRRKSLKINLRFAIVDPSFGTYLTTPDLAIAAKL